MSIEGMVAAIEKHGALEALVSDEMLLQHQANAQAVDPATGQVRRQFGQALMNPDTRDWAVAGSLSTGPIPGRRRLPRASRIARIDAHVVGPPSGAPLIAHITRQSPVAGETLVGEVRILAGASYGEAVLSAEEAPAGAWLGAEIDQAAGASDLSLTVTVEGR